MSPKYSTANTYELSNENLRSSHEYASSSSLTDDESLSRLLSGAETSQPGHTYLPKLRNVLPRTTIRKWSRNYKRKIRRNCFGGSPLRKLILLIYAFLTSITFVTIIGGTFFPSYTRPPFHYDVLRQRVKKQNASGSANVDNQKVFIAASIYDFGGHLAGGAWGEQILELVHLLGQENVYLSIYENDSGSEALDALAYLETRVKCNHTLIADEHLSLHGMPHITLPDGVDRVKRIAYLAEVRNRALQPLISSSVTFDKLLYLNDVVFDPIDAAQLLFSTNVDESGQTNYRAACAVDFIMPFKFYDTFATRDLEGYSMGIPFFPWFAAAGSDASLEDLLSMKDAVRVRSCWGGMVAFEAKYFQRQPENAPALITAASESPMNISAPYKFRAEDDLFWDASECCLIQADIQSPDLDNPGIYMNPFVRVAYDTKTLSWLGFTRRFERLYPPIHFILDILVGLPHFNPRRDERAWETAHERLWIPDEGNSGNGSFQTVTRLADHAGFCGRRGLSVMKENITTGDKNWEFIPVPS